MTFPLVVENFFPEAKALRDHFASRFKDPKGADSGRFVWDFWQVPATRGLSQYRLLRTPAWEFFPKALYSQAHQALVEFGRARLGCHDISPPWMSCYVDGCSQGFHGDLPHGPFAFVLSLSPMTKKSAAFDGGETVILKDDILDYWSKDRSGAQSGQSVEDAEIFHRIPPYFNQLVVFDPRVPHAVEAVRRAQGVLDGRLVIHGWFVNPRPFIEGPLQVKELASALEALSRDLSGMDLGGHVQGVLTFELSVLASGAVSKTRKLVTTLKGIDPATEKRLTSWVAEFFQAGKFAKKAKASRVVVPLTFA